MPSFFGWPKKFRSPLCPIQAVQPGPPWFASPWQYLRRWCGSTLDRPRTSTRARTLPGSESPLARSSSGSTYFSRSLAPHNRKTLVGALEEQLHMAERSDLTDRNVNFKLNVVMTVIRVPVMIATVTMQAAPDGVQVVVPHPSPSDPSR